MTPLQAFYSEAAIWKLLDHAHVQPFLGICRDHFKGTPCMISPWCKYGDIQKYTESMGFVSSDVHRLVRLNAISGSSSNHTEINEKLFQVASGLAYLHTRQAAIVHGDLRVVSPAVCRLASADHIVAQRSH